MYTFRHTLPTTALIERLGDSALFGEEPKCLESQSVTLGEFILVPRMVHELDEFIRRVDLVFELGGEALVSGLPFFKVQKNGPRWK